MKELTYLHKSLTYPEYRTLVSELLADGRVTGKTQQDDLFSYSKLNEVRMKRLDKTVSINEELGDMVKSINKSMVWLTLTEGWCGDAAQNIPILFQIAALNENIEFRLLLRDENLDLMDDYLTNGGRSIPKLIAIDPGQEKVLGTWGPRPQPAQERVMVFKKEYPDAPYSELSAEIHAWYAKDKGQTLQAEILDQLKVWLQQ
jgi:hypothetical protein